MAECRKARIPVMKAAFMQYLTLILRFIDIGKIDILRLTVLGDQFFSLYNVLFL